MKSIIGFFLTITLTWFGYEQQSDALVVMGVVGLVGSAILAFSEVLDEIDNRYS